MEAEMAVEMEAVPDQYGMGLFLQILASRMKVFEILLIISSLIIAGISVTKNLKKTVKTASGKLKLKLKPGPGGQEADYEFQTPIPQPYKNWNIATTKPLPYRAFKHKYTVTMGIRSLDWNNWIELDNQWPKFHQAKLERVEQKGKDLYETLAEAMDAAYELLDEFRRYLPHRYPSMFETTNQGMRNIVSGDSFNFDRANSEQSVSRQDPMLMAAKMVQDDLAIMMEGEDGQYYLKAGAIILPGFWRFRDKFNLPLSQIHTSGDVPKYNTHLKTGMEKFFSRLSCDKPVVRNNYFIQTDDNLGWSSSIGDENSDVVGWYTAEPAQSVDQLYFRSERQLLRRLPKSRAIVFTIRTYFTPLVELADEPHVPGRLLNAINSWSPDVQEYRGLTRFKDVVIPYLQEKVEEQERAGFTSESDPDAFPF